MTPSERHPHPGSTGKQSMLASLKNLVGPVYEELVRSKETVLAHIFHADRNVRIAAIYLCDLFWKCPKDVEFLDAYRKTAATDPDDAVRRVAVGLLGATLEGTRDLSTSQFLADTVKDSRTSAELREAAYSALRQVQLGLNLKEITRDAIAHRKLMLRKGVETRISEQETKEAFLDAGSFPESFWETADQIDWIFVDHFASEKKR